VGEAHAGRWIGNADEMLARRALNLPPGELSFTFQWLIAVLTVKLEFVCIHNLLSS
jgi:hypothetical protein